MQILQKMRPGSRRVGLPSPKRPKRSLGFTLLETLIALGILASIAVQLLSVQSNTISVTQLARDNMRATWALKGLLAQMQYFVEVYGLKALPEEMEIPWEIDPSFKIKLRSKEVSIEASKVFLTVMKLQKQLSMENPPGDEPGSPLGGREMDAQMKQLESVFSVLDTTVPKDIYKQIFVEVKWPDGGKTKELSSGLFYIDQKAITSLAGGATGGSQLPAQTGGAGP